MAEITKEQFKVVGKNTKTMESISRPNIGYWQDAWRRIRKNKIAFFSLCLIGPVSYTHRRAHETG